MTLFAGLVMAWFLPARGKRERERERESETGVSLSSKDLISLLFPGADHITELMW